MSLSDTRHLMVFIRSLGRPVFTTSELIAVSGRSASTIVQCLGRLARQGLLIKLYRGVWADPGARAVSAFDVLPHLFPYQRVYVSFITALHLHGIVEQVPQTITVASLAHSRTIRTRSGVYSIHQIAPRFFKGFDWYKGEGKFLIAEPEKALIDSLYLSGRKKKQFGHFPELHFPKGFSFRKAEQWAKLISEDNLRGYVLKKLQMLREGLSYE
jgi:predicted transcriptional regulator of viral defense system